jgi:energy-coupling factor transporter ATP-binding protein EcfA2
LESDLKSLRTIDTFGEIAAEDDPVLEYFLSTDAVKSIESGKILLVLGRKGSGKTALVRHFTETAPETHGSPLSLRSYPWNTHAELIDQGASDSEAYVASWRLLIAIRLTSKVVQLGQTTYTDTLAGLKKFLNENFGTLEPETKAIFSHQRLKVTGLSLGPQVAGVSLGSISFGDRAKTKILGLELDSLTNSLLHDVSLVISELGIEQLFLHFDELDQGLETLDETKKRMLIGLILAAREISNLKTLRANISPIVYLRSDIWEQVNFSDKNKISRTSAVRLVWDEESLKALIESRLSSKLGFPIGWSEVEDGSKMRGSQPKLQHMFSRTLLRPRDVIQFLNEALSEAKKRNDEPLLFENDDFNACRTNYSEYLKEELHDEIMPHFPYWEEALQACAKSQTITFNKTQFLENYENAKSAENNVAAEAASEHLYRFSVIGYLQPSAGGGSSWQFRYKNANFAWDSMATRLKVHVGLKEHANLKEERAKG